MKYHLKILLFLLFLNGGVSSQEESCNQFAAVVHKYVKEVDTKNNRLDQQLHKHMARAFRRAGRYESKLKRKLARTNSVKSFARLINGQDRFNELEHTLAGTLSIRQYISSFDTVSTTLKFFQRDTTPQSVIKASDDLEKALTSLSCVGASVEKAEEIGRYLMERNRDFQNFWQNTSSVGRFTNEKRKLSKQAFYYIEKLKEYKSSLVDHTKAEKKIMELLSRSRAFQAFMQKNSMLAIIFKLPADSGDGICMGSLSGLQSRLQVNNLIQQQVGINGQLPLHKNMIDARSQLQLLKQKVTHPAKLISDSVSPEGFKPNGQKTRSFLKRLDYGVNIQSQKADSFFPSTTDIGLSIGYKLNDKSIIGLGSSYKIGWGAGWKNINISHQGVGLRSFIDWKLKGNVWMSGGYEQNYRRVFRTVNELGDLDSWQQSGLLGLSKVIPSKSRFIKKSKLQLFWDFLSYKQVPGTQPILFRIGFGLNN